MRSRKAVRQCRPIAQNWTYQPVGLSHRPPTSAGPSTYRRGQRREGRIATKMHKGHKKTRGDGSQDSGDGSECGGRESRNGHKRHKGHKKARGEQESFRSCGLALFLPAMGGYISACQGRLPVDVPTRDTRLRSPFTMLHSPFSIPPAVGKSASVGS